MATRSTARLTSRWSSRLSFLAFVTVALVLGLVVFGRNLDAEFVNYDDPNVIIDNEVIEGPAFGHFAAVFGEVRDQAYLPLYYASYWLDFGLFGKDPFGFHLINILFHVLNSALLFRLWRRVARQSHPGMAAFAAGLFLVHPVVVESVSWASSRKDLLSMTLLLLGLLWFQSSVKGRRGNWGFGLAAMLFFAAMFAKATVLVGPILAWMLLRQLQAEKGKELLVSRPRQEGGLAAWAFVAVVTTAFHFYVARGQGTADVGVSGFGERVLGMLAVLGRYLRHLCLPFGLSVHYDHSFGQSFGIDHVNGMCALVSALVAGIWFWRRAGWIAFGWLWLFASLIPFNNIMPRFSIAMADRYLYLGVAGFSFAVSAFLWTRLKRWPWLAGMISLFFVLGGGYLARERTLVWANSESLWANALENAPRSALPPIQLGNAYETLEPTAPPSRRLGLLERAAELYSLAERRSGSAVERTQARMKLAPLLVRLGRSSEALTVFGEMKGDFDRAEVALDTETQERLIVSRAAAHLSIGQLSKAREQLRTVASASPHYLDALNLLAFADIVEANTQLTMKPSGEDEQSSDPARALFDQGLSKYAAILKIDPSHEKTRVEQVQALAAVTWRGDALIEASRLVRDLVEDFPKNAQARYLKGRLYAEVDPFQAERDLKVCIRLDPQRVEAYLLYESILRAQGRNKEAIAVLELGLRASPDSVQLKLAMSESFLSFAYHHRNTKNPVDALAAVVRSLRFAENNIESRLLHAELLQDRASDDNRSPDERAADWEACRKDYEATLKAASKDTQARARAGLAAYHRARGLALLYKATGRNKGSAEEAAAYDDLEVALRYGGDDPSFETTRGLLHRYSDRLATETATALKDLKLNAALFFAERALIFSEYDGERYALVARVRQARGEDQLALTNYDLALKAEPENLRCLYEMARLQFDMELWTQSAKTFRHFIVTAETEGFAEALRAQLDAAKALSESADKLDRQRSESKREPSQGEDGG